MLKGLFGKKKDNGFYLELDENAPAQPEAAVEEPVVVEEPVATVTEEPAATSEPAAAVTEAPATPAKPVKAKAKKTTKKKATAKTTRVATKTVAWEPPFWVKAMENAKVPSNGGAAGIEGENFSTKYLVPNGKMPRRRPGGSLDPFRNMARTVKLPRS